MLQLVITVKLVQFDDLNSDWKSLLLPNVGQIPKPD